MDITATPDLEDTGRIPLSLPEGLAVIPNILGILGPVMSASRMPTSYPCRLSTTAARLATSNERIHEQVVRQVLRLTVVVKGEPVINDATIEDAQFAGLSRIVEVIDNGSDGPGTILESCSDYFRQRFAGADLIVAKGQGNYETLSDVKKNIFFILKAKCPVIARDLGCKVGEMIFQKSKAFQGEKVDARV